MIFPEGLAKQGKITAKTHPGQGKRHIMQAYLLKKQNGKLQKEKVVIVKEYTVSPKDAPQSVRNPDQFPNESKEATIWVVGDSTVSAFSDQYYLPREGYGEELAAYFRAAVYNLARSGASSKDFTAMPEYNELLNGTDTIPALGNSHNDMFLVIGFGHNDEKTEEARFTDPTGDYTEAGSFAHSVYTFYVKPALDRHVTPVICTPIARLTGENTWESYQGESGHITQDITIGDRLYRGGDYAQALRNMVMTLKKREVNIELVDLTEATIRKNIALGESACWLHAYTGARKEKDHLVLTGLDQTHTNRYGAKMNAYLIARLSRQEGLKLGDYARRMEEPVYEKDFDTAVNPDYVFITYKTPTEEDMRAALWPAYKDTDGRVWRGTVFGDISSDRISSAYFGAETEENGITLHVIDNNGKIAGGSDGLMFYYQKIRAGSRFTLSAKARINSMFANNQVAFGLMARDDLYIDSMMAETMGDYVAAGVKNQGKKVNFGRKSGTIVESDPIADICTDSGTEVELKLSGTSDGFTLYCNGNQHAAGFDYPLTKVDPDYIYVGFFVARNCSITFCDIHLWTADPRTMP